MKNQPSSAGVHRMLVQLYVEDTDACGIVYYANYLRYAERARSEMFRRFGIISSDMIQNMGIALVVRHCNIDDWMPAKLDDVLIVDSEIKKIGGASKEIFQIIKKQERKLVGIDVRLGCVNLSNNKPFRLPELIRSVQKTELLKN